MSPAHCLNWLNKVNDAMKQSLFHIKDTNPGMRVFECIKEFGLLKNVCLYGESRGSSSLGCSLSNTEFGQLISRPTDGTGSIQFQDFHSNRQTLAFGLLASFCTLWSFQWSHCELLCYPIDTVREYITATE